MSVWHYDDAEMPLYPGSDPECGTTLCVAGWAAHLTGWIVDGGAARRGGDFRNTSDVGRSALALTQEAANELFLHTTNVGALAMLREMAGRTEVRA
jgi:hypothetical protein